MRKIIAVRRRNLYVALLVAAAIGHFAMCYPAATCRRSDRGIDPFWQYIAIYLGILAVGIPPAFDDLRNAAKLRNVLLVGFAAWASGILAIVAVNLRSPAPHIGHLEGIVGVLKGFPTELMIETIGHFVIVAPFVICWESVARGTWEFVRRFPDSEVRT